VLQTLYKLMLMNERRAIGEATVRVLSCLDQAANCPAARP
jgi:hypothetical protein